MEQKKLLWIVAAVSVFVLVIFGFALVIYSPPRTAETEKQLASAVIPGQAAEIARRNAAAVDPDSWVKNPEVTPGLDTEIVPSPQAKSLTSINSAYGASEAARAEEKSERAPAPAAAETISVRDLAQREERPAKAQEAAVASASAQGASSRASAAPARAEEREAPKPKAAASSAAPARQPVVEYWIQTGSFSSKLNAESARQMLTERYLNAEIFTKEINGAQTYGVRVGPYTDKKEADYWLGTITETPEFSGSYVSRVTAQR